VSNSLTGDFDVVVETAVPIVNRVLASQHQAVLDPQYEGPTYLHSFVVRVDDVPPKLRPHPVVTSGLHAVDPTITPLPVPPNRPVFVGGTRVPVSRPPGGGIFEPPLDGYTGVRGIAEVQLSAPTVSLPPGDSASKVAIAYQIMAHFVPDPGSPTLPEYVHGELTVIVDVNQVAWQKGNPTGVGDVIDIDFRSANLYVAFTPLLATDQTDQITTVIRNALHSSFGAMTTPLPAGISLIKFKTMDDPTRPAFALLADLRADAPPGPDPALVTEILLRDGDDFAIAAGRDYVIATLDQAVAAALPPPGTPLFTHGVNAIYKTITYYVFADQVTVDLQPGQIVLSIDGHTTHNSHLFGDISFTLTQALTLSLVGGVIQLPPVGDPSFTAHDGFWGWFINLIKGSFTGVLRDNSDSAVAQAQPTVQRLLDPSQTLGAVLGSVGVASTLAYTSVEIQTDGIILRGTLSVPPWPPVQVSFAQRNVTNAQGTLVRQADALNSWVPGGTVKKYTWLGQRVVRPVVLATDEDRFIASFDAPGGSGPGRLCLVVNGSRISASGPPVEEDVHAGEGQCSIVAPLYPAFPGIAEARLRRLTVVLPGHQRGALADSPDPPPPPEVLAQIAPWAGSIGGASNMLVHFADDRSKLDLAPVLGAIRAKTSKSAVSGVAVVSRGQLPSNGPSDLGPDAAFAFAEDHDGEWADVFSVRDKPATLLIDPNGETVWRHAGKLAEEELTAALDRYLVEGAMIRWGQIGLALGPGDPAPDFAFEFAPGHELVLHRLSGTRCLLVFWRSYPACLEHLRELESLREREADRPALLAINSGEPPEHARKVFDEQGCQAVFVPDPTEEITREYGVACWPTTITLDERRIVQGIRYGR
jgi:peroxiredoxin